MHEFSLMTSVMATVEEAAASAKATRVTEINLVVGRLTDVLPDAMEFAHQVLVQGTLAEGSRLSIRFSEPRSRCRECGLEFEHDRFSRICPACNALNTELMAGRELNIESIEVEYDD